MILRIGAVIITLGASKQSIIKAIYDWRLKMAIRKADRLAKWHRRKYVVMQYNGWPRVYERAALKRLLKHRTLFKKGTTMEQIDRQALYQSR